MDDIQWTAERPRLRDPIMIAAFEGWGDAGESARIYVRLDTSSRGKYFGLIKILNNDLDEAIYRFAVEGKVT